MRAIYNKIDVLLFGHKHVAGMWKNVNGIQYILACDNSPGKDWAREISIEEGKIEVTDLSIKPEAVNKKRKRRG
jgi:hypothetical protein